MIRFALTGRAGRRPGSADGWTRTVRLGQDSAALVGLTGGCRDRRLVAVNSPETASLLTVVPLVVFAPLATATCSSHTTVVVTLSWILCGFGALRGALVD